jgi:hypothetical protein
MDYQDFAYAGTAGEALGQLDDGYARWTDGVRGLRQDGLAAACGPAEGPFAERPMAALVLHISREVIHHGAEIALLRDLHARRPASSR